MDKEIVKKLKKELLKLNEKKIEILKEINERERSLKEIMKKYPICQSCKKNKFREDLHISTREEENNFNDKNDNCIYGPCEGEFYCGCLDYLFHT